MAGHTEQLSDEPSDRPRGPLLSPEIAGAGGLLIAGAVVAALVAHYQAGPAGPGGPGLVGDYRVVPAAGSSVGSSSGWTADGPFTVRVDGVSCVAAADASVVCTVRAEVSDTAAARYLPPTLVTAGGAVSAEPAAGRPVQSAPAGQSVPPGPAVTLVYRYRVAADRSERPLTRVVLGNGAPADALSVRRR